MRRLAGNDPEVNEEWITDKDRFAFAYAPADRPADPPAGARRRDRRAAARVVAGGLRGRRPRPARRRRLRVLTGGRLTAEDAYAYSKFARVVLGTNDIDFRARPHSAEEAEFLAAEVVAPATTSRTPTSRARPVVVLVGLEPEDEAGAIFLRLRKASRTGTRVVAVAPYTSRGLRKIGRPPGADLARRRGRGARARCRRSTASSALDKDARDPGRRAAGHRARRADRRGRAGPRHRRPARLGPAPRGRPRRGRDRLPAQPAARRPPGRRRRRARRRRHRLGRRPPARDRAAATPTASSRRSPPARSAAWSSAASTPTTWPTPPPPAPRSTPPASWSASSCARPT